MNRTLVLASLTLAVLAQPALAQEQPAKLRPVAEQIGAGGRPAGAPWSRTARGSIWSSLEARSQTRATPIPKVSSGFASLPLPDIPPTAMSPPTPTESYAGQSG